MSECVKVILILSLLLFPTGCWDRVEIEDRGFVIGIAIDFAKGQEKGESGQTVKKKNQKGDSRYAVTYQMVIPGAIGGQGQGKSGGGGDSRNSVFNLTTISDSMFEASRQFAVRTSRTPYTEHIKVLIISEEVAKSGQFDDVLDFYLRDHEMRRGTYVMVARGKARDSLLISPKNEKLPVMFIQSVADNYKKSAVMLSPMRIGDIHERLLSDESYIIPRIVPGSNGVKISGGAIFSVNDQMVGWLEEQDTRGLNLLTGKAIGGLIKVRVKGELAVYEFKGVNTTVKADTKDKNHIRFNIMIETEGNLVELSSNIDVLDPKITKELEAKFEKELEKIALEAAEKLKHTYKIDVIDLGGYLERDHPYVWKQIKYDWEKGNSYFTKSDIHVKVKAVIRNPGTVIKTEKTRIKD